MVMLSCKKIPVRCWVIALLALARFTLMSMTMSFALSWELFIDERIKVRYWPFCKLSEEERQNKTDKLSFGIWYNITIPDCGPRYSHWTIEQRDSVNAIQIFGQMLAAVASGIFVSCVGYPLYILMYCSIGAAALNSLRGIFVSMDWYILLVSELLLGMHIGAAYPAMVQWTARWAPSNERAIFEATFLADAIGSTLIRKIYDNMAPVIGYTGVYYLNSGLAILLCVLCFYVGGDDPETQRWISISELDKIKFSQKGKVTRTRCHPPLQHLLTSSAFWSINILTFGSMVANVFYFSRVIRQYLYSFVGIDGHTVEICNFIPYIGCTFGHVVAAGADKFLRSRSVVSEKTLGRIFVLISHLMTGTTIIIIGVAYCNTVYAIALTFIGYTFSGGAVVSCYRNIIDIAPNFAGMTYGFLHVFAVSTKMLVPTAMTYIFSFNRGVLGWSIVYLLGGGCVTGCGVIYLFFGTTKCQWWNLKAGDTFRTYQKQIPDADEETDDYDPNIPPSSPKTPISEAEKKTTKPNSKLPIMKNTNSQVTSPANNISSKANMKATNSQAADSSSSNSKSAAKDADTRAKISRSQRREASGSGTRKPQRK